MTRPDIGLAMSATTDDWELLAAYGHRRSEEAFARLVARYADLVFHTAYRRARGDRQLAEDVTQAVFIVLARSAATLKPTGSLAAWLHKTALYATNTALRAEGRRRRHERAAARDARVATRGDSVSNAGPTELVEQELHRLPAADRQVLAMHYLEGRTTAQTAEMLAVSVEAARKRVSRALQRLRERLMRRGVVVSSAGIASAVGAITTGGTSSASAAQLPITVVAGGKGGAAFSLASEVLRVTRFAALQKAAAVIVLCLGLTAGLIGVAAAQHDNADNAPVAPAATQPLRPTTNPLASYRSIELPETIRKALAHNARQLSPITVSFTVQNYSRLSVPELAKAMKIDEEIAEYDANQGGRLVSTWQDGKYYGSDKQIPRVTCRQVHDVEISFDGQDLYVGDMYKIRDGRESHILSIERLANYSADTKGTFASPWYFELAGLHLPMTWGELKSSAPATSVVMRLIEQGAKLTDIDEVELDGRKLTRLRLVMENTRRRDAEQIDLEKFEQEVFGKHSPESDESRQNRVEAVRKARQLPEQVIHVLWLDPQLNYALRRSEVQYDGGILLRRETCDDFRPLAGRDVSLPYRIVRENFTADSNPGVYFTPALSGSVTEVKDVKLDPAPDETFILDYRFPGTDIVDLRDPDNEQKFVVDEDGMKRARP
jgi:RNA polymerase sigma factor (sigma-70 family)